MPRFRIAPDASDSVNGWTTCSLADLSRVADAERDNSSGTTGLQRTFADLVSSEHLVILTGLGTSLEIVDSATKRQRFPTMQRLWGLVATKSGATFEKVRALIHYDQPSQTNIEELLSRCQMAVALGTDTSSFDLPAFIGDVETTISDECSYRPVESETATHEDFLRRVVRRSSRKPRPSIFTTNYDLCFEIAASRINLPLIDGFSFAQPRRFSPESFDYDIVSRGSYAKEPDYLRNLAKLYKLHGSVDWQRLPDGVEKREKPSSPLLIYPRYNKFETSYVQPFLEMMSRFQVSLRAESVGVVVVCFGFRDQHIAEPLLAAVKANASLRLVIVAPDLCGSDASALYAEKDLLGQASDNPYLAQLDRLIERGDNRLTFVNARFSEATPFIPLLAMQSESEQQETRIRDLERWVAARKRSEG